VGYAKHLIPEKNMGIFCNKKKKKKKKKIKSGLASSQKIKKKFAKNG
jgi:hypothetical protein